MRKAFIAGNWKMNKDMKGALELANGLKRSLADVEDVDIGLFPPALFLADVVDACTDTGFAVARRICTGKRKARSPGRFLRR